MSRAGPLPAQGQPPTPDLGLWAIGAGLGALVALAALSERLRRRQGRLRRLRSYLARTIEP